MRVINYSKAVVGLPGIGDVGGGEFREVTEAQIQAIESLPIVANWIRAGIIAVDRGTSISLDEEVNAEDSEEFDSEEWDG